MRWLVIVITLALAPTIETFNGHVTTNVAGATNVAYMLGMTAIDDFGGFLIIIGLLVAGGLFAANFKAQGSGVKDMLGVIVSVIITVVALAMFSGSVIGYIDALITAGTGFAKTAYGILPIIIYVGIIAGAATAQAVKTYKGKKKSKSMGY